LKICDAVAFAHDKGIVHLDLKPANIRLGKFGEVLLCDWGLAKIISENELTSDSINLDPDIYNDATLDGIVKGSPGFLAPEQVSSKYGSKDERTDIYALGGILYNLLTLKKPVNTESLRKSLTDTVSNNIEDPLRIDSSIPQSLAAVTMKALSRNKEDRYHSVLELRGEINKWLSGFATDAEDADFWTALWLFTKRHRQICLFSAVVIVLVFSFTVQVITKERRALEARELYLEEKEKARLDALRSVPHLVMLTNQSMTNSAYDEALEYINMANEKDPQNIDVWSLKGKVHFVRQEYMKSFKAFENAPSTGRALWIVPLLKKLYKMKGSQEFLDFEQMEVLIKMIGDRGYSYPLCAYPVQRASDLDFAVKTSMLSVKHDKYNRKVNDWDFEYEIDNGKVILDFSGISQLRSLRGMKNLPIKKLDISNTSVEEHETFLDLPLEEMNISGSKIINPLALLKIKTLKKVIINKGQYPNMQLSRKRFILK
ncbi:MAG: protein kinase, partial [Lentisphaeraceae bacterium]|nr:protein kinase [Lentisphaeraceae bacterium]